MKMTKSLDVKYLTTALILILAGCSTIPETANDENWIDLFTPAPQDTSEHSPNPYGLTRVERDATTLAEQLRR